MGGGEGGRWGAVVGGGGWWDGSLKEGGAPVSACLPCMLLQVGWCSGAQLVQGALLRGSGPGLGFEGLPLACPQHHDTIRPQPSPATHPPTHPRAGEMRQAYLEKAEGQKMKQKARERMQPKMGKLDIDYQVGGKHSTLEHLYCIVGSCAVLSWVPPCGPHADRRYLSPPPLHPVPHPFYPGAARRLLQVPDPPQADGGGRDVL